MIQTFVPLWPFRPPTSCGEIWSAEMPCAKVLVNEYVQPRVGARILEIGCGPGTIVGYLPPSDYLGFDLSPEYIEQAKRRFPNARFVCERVSQFSLAKEQSFDVVLALGIVHHLDDAEARATISNRV